MKSLSSSDFLVQSQQHLLLDVRSPKEFQQGHIPHAHNLPLFENDERTRVGTTYKQRSKAAAIEEGLELVGPKMATFARFVKPLVRGNKILVHCWRGGMRSGSMAWLFELLGYEVYTLRGGYKAYRNFVLETTAQEAQYIVIGGYTGSGKTPLLQHLQQLGEQIIDLEKLAHHKGSAFGGVLEKEPPTSEQFENNLCGDFLLLDKTKRIWLEVESRNVGRCYMPLGFWQQLRKSPLLVLEISVEARLQQVLQDYGQASITELEDCFLKIERRLGNEAMKTALHFLQEKNLKAAAAIALHYYDKTYAHSLSLKETKAVTHFSFPKIDLTHIAQKFLDYANAR